MGDDRLLPERARAVADLRDAEAKIERHMPESPEKWFVLTNVREALAELDDSYVTCRRRGTTFTFDARHFREKDWRRALRPG